MQVSYSGLTFLTDVARLLGLDNSDEITVLYLTLEGGGQITVSLETDTVESLLLYTELGDVPVGDTFLRDIGQANFLGAGTGSAVLALRPDASVACCFRRVLVGIHSPEDFLPILKAFCEVATSWQQRLRTY